MMEGHPASSGASSQGYPCWSPFQQVSSLGTATQLAPPETQGPIGQGRISKSHGSSCPEAEHIQTKSPSAINRLRPHTQDRGAPSPSLQGAFSLRCRHVIPLLLTQSVQASKLGSSEPISDRLQQVPQILLLES